MTISNTVSNTTFSQLRSKVNEVIFVVNGLGVGDVSNAYVQATFATKAYAASNVAVRLLINDRLQVSNAAATYQTKAVERAALANTNARINLLNTNLTSTNTALRALDAQKLSVANATTLFASKASWVGLTGTNTALRTLISDRIQVANVAATYQTIAAERSALANTNAYIAAQANRITLVNTNLVNTNTAIRALDAQKLSVANASVLLAAKASWASVTSTNAALRILISDRLQVANANNKYATKAYAASNVYVKSILANTNAYIADVQSQIAAANEVAQDVIDYGFITSSVDVDTLRDYGTL